MTCRNAMPPPDHLGQPQKTKIIIGEGIMTSPHCGISQTIISTKAGATHEVSQQHNCRQQVMETPEAVVRAVSGRPTFLHITAQC